MNQALTKLVGLGCTQKNVRFLNRRLALTFLILFTPALNALELNGIAVHSELRRDFYVGALYTTVPTADSSELLGSEQHKRMVLRVIAPRWSARSFAQHWTQSILINNEQAAQDNYAKELLSFTSALKGKLLTGDELVLDHQPGSEATFSVNGVKLFSAADGAGFFRLLLNAWIGARPPSSSFKQDILQAPDDSEQMLTIFHALTPTSERLAEVKGWTRPNSRKSQGKSKKAALAASGGTAKPQAAKAATRAAARPAKTAIAAAKQAALAAEPAAGTPQKAEQQTQLALDYERKMTELRELYKSKVIKQIYSKVNYPGRAISRQQEGSVEMRLRLAPDGELIDASISNESNHSLLNKAALKALQDAAPFPPAPKKLNSEEIAMSIPIRFKIPR